MIISEIGIRGFKSFGNNEQVLNLNTKRGELILLAGKNGAGKSSLLESIDYVLYGKCRGKKKKWTTLSTIPNRINGEMSNRIKFSSLGTEVEIKRGINPNILELIENGNPNDRAGKSNLDDKIESYIGMDVETFKSFISMSINDFKNFISLSNEEKQLLLDKLFNLEVINILNNILKELNKSNKIRMSSLDSEISTLEESIKSVQDSISKSIEKEKENLQSEIDDLKNQMDSKKEDYQSIKSRISNISSKSEEISQELDKEKSQLNNIQSELRLVNKEIGLYDSGKCPTCSTNFDSDHFISLRSVLVEKKKSLEDLESTFNKNISSLKEKKIKLQNLFESANKTHNDITVFLRGCKSQIDKLLQKKNSDSGIIDISEFEKSINDLGEKKKISLDQKSISKDKEIYYKELSKIFSEEGVKKSIISGIIKPINHFISENVKNMGLPFEVVLDETFTAMVSYLGPSVDHESLSTGETKRINLCILVAYLKLIRTKKHINILFLDEVFASIDVDGISDILRLLKSFANEYNVNIFVVHHAILNLEDFDRVIKVEKNVFSTLSEVELQ